MESNFHNHLTFNVNVQVNSAKNKQTKTQQRHSVTHLSFSSGVLESWNMKE